MYAEILRLAWPLIVSTGSFTIMTFCDRMFLSWHSAVAIQAALPAGILSFTLVCGFMALAAYANTFVAQFHGAGDRRGCSRATFQGVLFSLLSWPCLLALIPFGRWLLRISGHAPEVLAAELPYFTVLMIGSVTTPLSAALSGFFSGRGDTRTTMYAHLVGNGLNIVLDYALIFGKWGFPALGIVGAAWATVIASVFTPVILFACYFSKRYRAYDTRGTLRYDHALFWRMVRFGLPAGVHLALDIASFSVFILLTGRLGATALSASNIVLSINTLAFMPLIGLGITASILVGQYQGRGDSTTAEMVGWATWKLGLCYVLLTGVFFVLTPRPLVGLFARGAGAASFESVFPTARILLMLVVGWGLADAGNLTIGNALKGAGDTRFVMIYSVIMAWFVLALGQVVLMLVLQRGIVAAWLWTAFYIALLATGYILRFRSGAWKSIDVLGRQAPVEPLRPGSEALGIAE